MPIYWTDEAVITNGILGMFRERLTRVVGRRSCWPKETHDSEGAATAQLRSIVRRGLAKDVARIHVYRCPECSRARGMSAWHVGHAYRTIQEATA